MKQISTLLLLSDGISSSALLHLYWKNSDLTITEARKNENNNKNRYRDISSYRCLSHINKDLFVMLTSDMERERNKCF